jgi:sugar phosphate isomerase/epimerase
MSGSNRIASDPRRLSALPYPGQFSVLQVGVFGLLRASSYHGSSFRRSVKRDFAHDHSALALNTATLGGNVEGAGQGWPVERVIDACAMRGIGHIVFRRREIGSRATEIGNRGRAAGMQVAGLCRAPYPVGRDAPAPDDTARASIDMAAARGAPVLTIVTGGTNPGRKGLADTRARLADRVAALARHAAAAGVSLALEPLNPMFVGNRTGLFTVAETPALCDRIAAPNLGIAVDVHQVWWDGTLAASLARAKGRILGYHLCDWLEDTQDMLLDRGMMGDGVADLRAIRAAVERAGYAGPCEVEVFSARNWWRRDPGEVLDTMIDRFRKLC